jgi:superoxide dismutase, Fe-Mn family
MGMVIRNSSGHLEIRSTPNQDNPLMDISEHQEFPIPGLDLWEHACYLKYQNRRLEYLNLVERCQLGRRGPAF